MSDIDIEDARKWIRLHEHNEYQREAARRMTRLVNEVEDLRHLLNLRTQALSRVVAERDEYREVLERAIRLIDAWEHDAPDVVLPLFMDRMREALALPDTPTTSEDA